MDINLSNDDHDLLDRYLEAVLERYRSGQCELIDARGDIAEAFSLLARGNENFRHHMRASLMGDGE